MAGISSIVIFVTAIVATYQQVQYDCPMDWAASDASEDGSRRCYHFVFYPTLPYEEASQACHQDGASLVSVNTAGEHIFLVTWLSRYGGSSLYQWYTSGVQMNGIRKWEGDGDSMAADSSYWAIDPSTESQVASGYSEAHLVYQYQGEEHREDEQPTEKSGFGWAWASGTLSLPYICEIQLDEVYRLYQKDRDFSFGSSSPNPNDWLIGPKFSLVSPSVVFAGRAQQLSIECAADGNPAPSYKWYKDYGTTDQQLVTATDPRYERYTITNGRLTISSPDQNQDPGTYTCVAENSVGKVFGNPVLVSAGYLGEFSNDKPGFRTAILYQGAVIDCSPPNYNPAVMFQWMKDKMFIRPEMNPHTFLSENGNLYFSEIQAADAAEYHCIVNLVAPPGERLATSQPLYGMSLGIPLQIDGENANVFGPDIHNDFPAVFPRQPLTGQEMRIECLAYGRLPLFYSWSRVDGGEIPMDRAKFGSLGRVMTISDARLEDSGTYMCTVKGPKNVDTRNITISMAAAPYFKFPLRDQHLDVNSKLTWVCDAVAIPPARYGWYRDGQPLLSDDTKNIQVNKNVLTITDANADNHNGMYECMASNDHGTQISIAQIRVLSFKPSFDLAPIEGSLMGTVGGNLTIPCQPEGAPQPTIVWTHNGSPIGTSGRFQVLSNNNLLLTGLDTSDAGEYTCEATNDLGTASSTGHLTVLRKTTLFRKPVPRSVIQNSTAHIPCQASYAINKTDLVYVWYFNGRLLDLENEPSLNIAEQAGVQGLYIVGAQFEHEGRYDCRATTVYDSANADAYLTVLGPPDEPAGVHVHSIVGTEVTLWWQPGKIHGELITLYRIDFSSNFDPTWRMLVDGIQASQTQVQEYTQWRYYVIPANTLSPGTQYRFRVYAASANFGYGQPSIASDSVKLADAAPIFAPDVVTGGGGSVGTLRVKWLPLPPEKHGGSGLYYKVYWRKHRNPDDLWRSSKEKVYADNPDRYGFIYFHQTDGIGMDNFYTEYDVRVQAINKMGAGPNSTVETIMSAEDIPVSTPQGVYAEGLNASAGIVYWQLPNNTREGLRGKVLGYQMNWWHWGEDNAREIIKFKRVYGQDKQGIIIGLFANDNYWVDVQVFNTAGLSRPSGRAYLNTNYEAPLTYPWYVTVSSHGPESVHVSWRGISTIQLEAPVSGFAIWYWPYTDNIRTAKIAQFPKVFSGVIHGIERDKIYKMRVMGTSSGGYGKKSPPTFFTLGGQVRFDPRTSEILASASLLKPSVLFVLGLSVLSYTL